MQCCRRSFADALDLRHNSFDLLRFVLAALVVLLHCYVLGGLASAPGERFISARLGPLAVPGFFAISGFLITRSYVQSSSLVRYLWQRGVRILPAYWTCLLLTAGVLAPLMYWLDCGSLSGFAAVKPSALSYVAKNWTLIKQSQGEIAGFWSELPVPRVLNGSLWSLPYEVKCYLLVAALGIAGVLRRQRIVLAMWLAAWGLLAWNHVVPGAAARAMPLFRDLNLLTLLVWFLGGAAFFLFRERIPFDHRLAALLAVATAWAMLGGRPAVIAPLTVPYLLFWAAAALPCRRFGRYGDFSYGLYIYAFPVQQMLTYFGLNAWGLGPYFALSLMCTLPLAVGSYYCIERPALRLKHVSLVGRRSASPAGAFPVAHPS